MTLRLAICVQLVLLFVQYASLQLQYPLYTEGYYGDYKGNYNNPGNYQNSMLNYIYGYSTTESNNDLTEEDATERIFSEEIHTSSLLRKRNKRKKKKSKNNCCYTDSKGCESEYNSSECKSADEGRSTECRECTCPECVPDNSYQNSCCPNYCEQCLATQLPRIAVMAFPIPFPMPAPMPYPSPTPDDCTTDPSSSTTDNSHTRDDSNETTDCTTAHTKPATEKTTCTTDNSEETTHTTDDSKETSHTTHNTEITTHTTDDSEETTHSTKTSSTTTFPIHLMEFTSTSPIFKSTTTRSTTITFSTKMSASITSRTNLMERIRQPVYFEQYHYPNPIRHRRPVSDHYHVSSNKRDKISPMYQVRKDAADDESDIRMIVIKDRERYDMLTHPPDRLIIRPHREYENEMQTRNDFKARYVAKRYPQFPTRRDNLHNMPKYGILPLSDKIATKLLLKLRNMKELNTHEKNIPKIRKLKQK